MMSFHFSTSQSIIAGAGSIASIPTHCQFLKMTRILFVTDPGIVKLGLHGRALERCKSAGLECYLYSKVSSDPSEQVVIDAIKFARQHEIDGIVGIGGGSPLDVAKLVAVLSNSEQELQDIYGVDKVNGVRLPLIQIPTTAGTGSEVTPISIVTINESKKAGIVSHQLLADIAILDPSLTMNLPPHITAATGIDAMVHAIEAYTSKIKKNIYSDMLARKALSLLSANIIAAVEIGRNVDARANMMIGACLAGQAFANAPVAAVHALAYPLGSYFHIPHGLSNALVLPHVLRFNVSCAADLYAELAPLIIPNCSVENRSSVELSYQLIEYIEALILKLGLPSRLRDMGIQRDDLPRLAKAACEQQRLLVNNPREVMLSDALSIYSASF